MAALVEALIGEEFQVGGIFGVHPLGHLAAQIAHVLAQGLQHVLLVGAKQGLHEHGGVAKIGRHPHLGDRDTVAGERLVMDVAAHQYLGQGMTDLLADAQQADRAAFGGFIVAHHFIVTIRALDVARARRLPSSSNSSASKKAMVLPWLTSRPLPITRPGFTARTNDTFMSMVAGMQAPSVLLTRAGPIVSSSMAATKPPCTVPCGLRKASPGWKAISTVPASGSSRISSQPSVSAAGGAGKRLKMLSAIDRPQSSASSAARARARCPSTSATIRR